MKRRQFISLLPAAAAAQMVAPNHEGIVYTGSQALDIYYPAKGEPPYPLIVWVHGGAWRSGTRHSAPLWVLFQGFAVASISYRLSGVAKFPAQIEDCKSAIRFLRGNAAKYKLDAGRIAVWGASAGGHLAALLGVTHDQPFFEPRPDVRAVSADVHAVIDFYGPTDLLQMSKFPSRIDHDAPDSPESLLIGGPIQQNKEKAERANPIRYVTKDDPPFLIVHGGADPLVPPNQSVLLEQALRQAGVPVEFTILEGAGHGGPPFESARVQEQVKQFLFRSLKIHGGSQ